MKFASKLTLSVTLVSVVFLPLLGAILYWQARSALAALIVADQQTVARHTMSEIDRLIRGTRQDIIMISEDEFLQQYFEKGPHTNPPSQRGALVDELKEREHLSGPWQVLFTAGPNRLIDISTRRELTGRPIAEFRHSKVAYDAAMQGKVYTSGLIISDITRKIGVVFAAPIWDRTKRKANGAVIALFDWSAVLRLINEIDSIHKAYLFDSGGMVIGAQRSNQDDILRLDLGHLPVLAPLLDKRREGVATLTLDTRTGPLLASVTFQQHRANYPYAGWGVLVGSPVDLAFAPITRLTHRTIGLAAASMFAVAVLFYLIGRSLAQPIEMMTRGVQRVAGGDLQAKVPVTGQNELSTLARAFNQMTDDLYRTTLSRDYVEGLLRTLNDSLFVLAPDATITLVNQAALSLLGYTEQELLGSRFDKVLPDKEWLDTTVLTGFVGTVEKQFRTQNGHSIPVLLSVSGMQTDTAGAQYIVCTALDISERKRSEEALRQKSAELQRVNVELEQFAYVASHDLKAPLRAVSQLASWIAEDASECLDEENRKRLELMRDRVIRMDRLIEGLLAYSRAGRVTGKVHEPVPLKPLLEELTRELSLPTGFLVEMGEPLPILGADPLHLKQIFQNLISNAATHHEHPESGRVRIDAEEELHYWRIEVADNGPGIPAEARGTVFELFSSLAPESGGIHTGIGLTIVRKLVLSYGGQIDIVDNRPNGARFRIWWPKTPGSR